MFKIIFGKKFTDLIQVNKKGFTLIELLIIMSVIAIGTSITLVFLGNSRENKVIETQADRLVSFVREAQNNSLTGKRPESNKACGYGIHIDNNGDGSGDDSKQFKLFYNTAANCEGFLDRGYGSNSVDVDVFALENDVEFDTIKKTFYFTIPHGDIYFNEIRLSSVESIVINKNSQNYYICVYPSGKIEQKKDSC